MKRERRSKSRLSGNGFNLEEDVEEDDNAGTIGREKKKNFDLEDNSLMFFFILSRVRVNELWLRSRSSLIVIF